MYLKKLEHLFSSDNIWGNLQASDRPARLRWDLSVGSDWSALFGRQFTNPGLNIY